MHLGQGGLDLSKRSLTQNSQPLWWEKEAGEGQRLKGIGKVLFLSLSLSLFGSLLCIFNWSDYFGLKAMC